MRSLLKDEISASWFAVLAIKILRAKILNGSKIHLQNGGLCKVHLVTCRSLLLARFNKEKNGALVLYTRMYSLYLKNSVCNLFVFGL